MDLFSPVMSSFTKAIVRRLSRNYKSCVSSHPDHKSLDLKRAMRQHQSYVQTLQELGLDVIVLEGLDEYPDCCFVEDTAVIQNNIAVVTHMGELTRRGEVNSIEIVLKENFSGSVKIMDASVENTLEGGDVMHFSDFLISGVTSRTSRTGVKSLEELIGVPIKLIKDQSIVHLKSYMTPISDDLILTTRSYEDHKTLEQFEKIVIPDDEKYAANTLTINDVTIIPSGFPKSAQLLREKGLELIELDMTEFSKCEGALSCLSLLF